MLKLLKHFSKKIILMPFIILEKALSKSALAVNMLIISIRRMPRLMRSHVFQLVKITQLPGFTKIAETQGGIENIVLPKIVGLSNGGSISVNMSNDYLCKLNNVSFVPHSDFIRDENCYVANEKLFRKEYDVLIPRDRDILEIKGKTIRLSNNKNKIHFKIAFNLMGTYSMHWAHFLAQYYPKLMFLNDLPKEESIELIIPKNTDPHIKYLIEHELKNYPHIGVMEVAEDSEIMCEKLYHVSLGTFVGDDGYLPTTFGVEISNSTLKFWNEKVSALVPKDAKQYRKIFIGRTGNRSITNYKKVLEFFIDKGFEEIFPHLLTMEEKIKIFSEAKYIVGPASSGFTNAIFSQSGTKMLAFINSFRYLDTYLPVFSNYKKHEFWFMTGKDDNIKEMNSNYEISLNDIKLFLEENYFLDNQGDENAEE